MHGTKKIYRLGFLYTAQAPSSSSEFSKRAFARRRAGGFLDPRVAASGASLFYEGFFIFLSCVFKWAKDLYWYARSYHGEDFRNGDFAAGEKKIVGYPAGSTAWETAQVLA